MTKRLPASLKKRLQASLETLSAKEAGRLFVIYSHEADRKDIDIADYGPAKELEEALNAQVARSRGKPGEAEAVNRYNGFVFLTALFHELNFDFGPGFFMAGLLDAVQAKWKLFLLIQQDVTTETIRMIRDGFIDQPKPLSREEYDWLMEWSRNDALVDLGVAADGITHNIIGEQDEDEAYDALYDDIYQATYNALVEKIQAGELVGGESIFSNEIDSPLLIADGTIPAWAALRMVWRQYVIGRGLRIYDMADYAEFAPEMVDRIGGSDGDALDNDALQKLATDFYKDCRRRPWGKKGLVAKVAPDVLVKLLTQSPNPLLHRNAPDLGRVDWATFQKAEVAHDGEPFETGLAATVASLNQLDPDFRKGYDFTSSYYQEQFYPTANPDFARMSRDRLFRMMSILDTSRQPFTYDRKEEGMMTMSDLIGIKFLTPFEQKVADLRQANNSLASVKEAIRILSDRYFGGLPILLSGSRIFVQETEEALESANEALNQWLDRIQGFPWEIDTSDLRLGEPEIDQDLVDLLIKRFIDLARRRSRINEPEDVLFGGEVRHG